MINKFSLLQSQEGKLPNYCQAHVYIWEGHENNANGVSQADFKDFQGNVSVMRLVKKKLLTSYVSHK